MQVDEKDFQKLHFLIDKIAEDANIKGTIQHINLLDLIDWLRKEVNRASFVKEIE